MQEIAPFVKILGCYPVDSAHGSPPSPVVETGAAENVSQQIDATRNGSSPGLGVPADSEKLLISAAANILPIHQASETSSYSTVGQIFEFTVPCE